MTGFTHFSFPATSHKWHEVPCKWTEYETHYKADGNQKI